MNKKTLPILVCPKCKGKMDYEPKANELVCTQDKLAYPIRNGIPILLETDARNLNETQ